MSAAFDCDDGINIARVSITRREQGAVPRVPQQCSRADSRLLRGIFDRPTASSPQFNKDHSGPGASRTLWWYLPDNVSVRDGQHTGVFTYQCLWVAPIYTYRGVSSKQAHIVSHVLTSASRNTHAPPRRGWRMLLPGARHRSS